MAFREGQPTDWLGAGPQVPPIEKADAPLTHTRKGVEKKAVASAKVLALPLLPLAQAQAQKEAQKRKGQEELEAQEEAKAKAPMRKTPMRKVKKAAPKKTGSKTKKQASMRKAAMRRATTLVDESAMSMVDESASPSVVSLQRRFGHWHRGVWVPLFASPAQARAYDNIDREPCPDGDDCDDPDCEDIHPMLML